MLPSEFQTFHHKIRRHIKSMNNITDEEREVIMIRLQLGDNPNQIATLLGRHRSSIYREIKRNSVSRNYSAIKAHQLAASRKAIARRAFKIEAQPVLKQYIDEKLKTYWSPEQISGRLKYCQYPEELQASYETIYLYIQRASALGETFKPYLRFGYLRHESRGPGNKQCKRIPNKKHISLRPKEVEGRKVVGHWESDSVRGAYRTPYSLATHLERKTRFGLAGKLKDRKASTFNEATINLFERNPELPLKTMTTDHGMEFSKFKELERELDIPVYFATAYCSNERGANENYNGLIRQFVPKGMNMEKLSQKELDRIVDLLNDRPRKCLGFRTPREAMEAELVAISN